MPRSVFPSTAIGSVPATPVVLSHWPSAASKAWTSSALKTRCRVATHGRRPGGTPSASSSAGSSWRRSSAHWAIAYKLRAPHNVAATVTCNSATRGIGACAGRHPYGRRGSGTVPSAAANEPGGAAGPAGTGLRAIFRMAASAPTLVLRLGGPGYTFFILVKRPWGAMGQPRQRPLHQPALGQRDKALCVRGPRDDGEVEPILLLCLGLQCASIVTIPPEFHQLRIPGPIQRQQQRGPIAI